MIPCFLRVSAWLPVFFGQFRLRLCFAEKYHRSPFSSDSFCLSCFPKSKNSQKKCPTGCAFSARCDTIFLSSLLCLSLSYLDTICFLRNTPLIVSKSSSKRFLALKLWSQMSRQLRLFLSAFSPVLRRCLLHPPSLTCSIFPHFLWIWAFHLATVTHRLCCVPWRLSSWYIWLSSHARSTWVPWR